MLRTLISRLEARRDGGSKRRRTCRPPSGSRVSIGCLSSDILVAVADYLPKTSRALLAVALTAPPSSWRERGWVGEPSKASRDIISSTKPQSSYAALVEGLLRELQQDHPEIRDYRNDGDDGFKAGLIRQLADYYEGQWKVLDFVDIERSLATRLTDEDLGAILVCINAKNKLWRLNLTHCYNVVGHGLEPLRSSTVLKKVDMGLVVQIQLPTLIKDAILSEDAVLPIVNDILRVEDNSFQRLQVPEHWCPRYVLSEGLEQVLRGQKYMINRNGLCCYFGLTSNTDIFLKQLRMHGDLTDTCVICGDNENTSICSDCKDICCAECENNAMCTRCKVMRCGECEKRSKNPVYVCIQCHDPYCHECRIIEHSNGNIACTGCKDLLIENMAEVIAEKKATIDAQQTEIEELRRKVEGLREKCEVCV